MRLPQGALVCQSVESAVWTSGRSGSARHGGDRVSFGGQSPPYELVFRRDRIMMICEVKQKWAFLILQRHLVVSGGETRVLGPPGQAQMA
ncbi:MAG: hypothetical protein JSU63_16815 [Phycisphaerales bacterium]|nr:MAG: hypothetical protein JSU63_16815 [Phycisphaerales bacterium]